MTLRAMAVGAVAAGMLAVPQVAQANWGQVANASALNLRACPSAACAKIAVMPRGAPVWINGVSGGWYQVVYNGVTGYASGRYIVAAAIVPTYPNYVVRTLPPPPPPSYWWGPRYNYWYGRPSGLYLGFRFGH